VGVTLAPAAWRSPVCAPGAGFQVPAAIGFQKVVADETAGLSIQRFSLSPLNC
jgi:hypothetical protein